MLNLDKTKEFLEKEVDNKSKSVARKLEILCAKVRSSNNVSDTDISNIVAHLVSLKKTASALETVEIIVDSRDSNGDLADFLDLV